MVRAAWRAIAGEEDTFGDQPTEFGEREPFVPSLQQSAGGREVMPPYVPGDEIAGRFDVRQVWHGGMAWVFVVFDRVDRVPRALKTLRWEAWDDASRRARLRAVFRQEVATWIALGDHPNIVGARWAEEFDGRLMLALEFVPPAPDVASGEPRTLRHYAGRVSLSPEELLLWALAICEGTAHAHANGVEYHGDLKPANIMVTHHGSLKVTDFGLANVRALADSEGASLPGSSVGSGESPDQPAPERRGAPIGTLGYRSPEQQRGELDLDARTDVYSFGLVLHQLATDSPLPPFVDSMQPDPDEVYRRQMCQPARSFDGPLWPLVRRCLIPDRDKRHSSFVELREEIAAIYRAVTGREYGSRGQGLPAAWQLSNRAITFFSLGQLDKAIQCSAEALEQDPGLASAWNTHAAAHAAKGDYGQAERDYAQVMRLRPGDPRVLCNVGALLLDRDLPARALATFDEAISLDERCGPAYRGRAKAQAGLHNFEKALADYGEAISLNPRSPTCYYERGILHAQMKHLDCAIDDYGRAIELDPLFSDAYRDRALCLVMKRDFANAIHDLRTAVALDPIDATLWFNLGNVLARAGQLAAADECLSKALRLSPEDPELWNDRGNVLAEQGCLAAARDHYQEAVSLMPQFSEAWLHKGSAEEALGLTDAALDSYRQAARVAPPGALVLERALRRIEQLAQGEEMQ